MSSRKRKRLDAIALAFQQRWGTRALRRGEQLGSPAQIPGISTGFPRLDQALAGIKGIPRSRVTEFIGAPTSGMATLALRIIAQAQAERDMAAFLDLGATFDPDYAHRCGINLSKLLLVRPQTGSEALAITQSLIASRGVGVLVLDSVAHLLAEPQGAQALAVALRQLSRVLAQSPCAAIFLCPLTSHQAVFPANYPSASPLPHYAAVRLLFVKERWLYKGEDVKGYEARVQVIKNRLGELEHLRQTFLTGAQAKGVPADIAETVFDQLRAFGGYSFAKSHASSFAVLVYQSAWLKFYYPVQYYVSLMRNQPLGFWEPAVLVMDAKRHGIAILPVDLERSQASCTVEGDSIRLGFDYVAGFGEASLTRLIAARQEGRFKSLADLCRRTRLPRRLIERLIMVGALDGWGRRRSLLWELGQLRYQEDELDLVFPTEAVELPSLSRTEAFMTEYEILGLSTGEHVMALYRPWLKKQGILSTDELKMQPNGKRVCVAGLVVVHQSPPTAKNHHFVTLESEFGLLDVIVQPRVYASYRRLLHTERLLIVEGVVQHQDGVVNLLALRAAPLPPLGDLSDDGPHPAASLRR